MFDSDVDADVFGIASDELEASVHAFFVRSGSIRGERNWSVERVEDVSDAELIADLITQVYSETTGESAAVSDSTVVTEQRNASVRHSRDRNGCYRPCAGHEGTQRTSGADGTCRPAGSNRACSP